MLETKSASRTNKLKDMAYTKRTSHYVYRQRMNIFLEQVKKDSYVIIALAAPLLILYFVWNYGINVPFSDQWELIPLLEKLHDKTLTLADLWQQHNEHRIIFPKILMLFLAHFSNWNIFLELCTNMVLAIINLLFLFSILRNTSESLKSPWLKIIISLLIFSMVQYENWFWGWQIQIFMSVLGAIIAIWSVNKWQGKTIGLTIAISAAILSSYSFSTGLVTWPAVVALLLLQKKWKLKHIIIWLLTCITTVLLFYHNYTKSNTNAPFSFILSHPSIYIRYVLTYLGSSLGHSRSSSQVVASIMLIITSLAIFDIRRLNKERFRNLTPWLALAIYAILAACVTGAGRIGLGSQQALASRYTTISTLLVISAAVTIYHSMELNLSINKKRSLKDILFIIAITSVFCLSYSNSYTHGVKEMKKIAKCVNESAFCLTDPENADDDSLKRLYPNPDVIRQRIKVLSELGIKFKTTE
jgi:hypothetical protein